MKFKQGFKVRTIAGENVVIMQGASSNDMTRIISLNDTSLMLWNELQNRDFEVEDIAEIIVNEYGIEAERALHDAKAWVARLKECGLV